MQRTNLSRRALLATLGSAIPRLTGAPPSGAPNIVVILADDQGWGDLSVNGNRNLSTPRIDSLAHDGAMLEQFYVCAVCAPTRAEFLTGRYHARGGVHGVSTGAERLNLDEKTIAQVFQSAGYATGAFGKWHNGSQFPYHPRARGFDEYYGFTSGHWANYFDTEMDHNGKLVQGKGYITDDLTRHAIRFIEGNRSKPFFCYLPLNTPHSPMQVPEEFYSKFAKSEPAMKSANPAQEDMAMTRAALAMCENIDTNVGKVLDALDRWRLRDNTIVIYFSDNGPNSWRWNGRMKGRKGTLDEGGLRSPFLIRWPKTIEAGTRVKQIAGAIDLLPTLTDLAGVPLAAPKPLDGISLKPLLTLKAGTWPDRKIFTLQNQRATVRTQRFRLDAEGKLFDIAADQTQATDVTSAHPQVAAELRSAVEVWRREMLKASGNDTRPFTVGYSPSTLLPARDGVGHGGIKRSATAPNSSYFTNWTREEDSITWDIEVGRASNYDVVVHYTCAPDDVGSTITANFGQANAAAVLTRANNPPLQGESQDRTSRGPESFWKTFKPFTLGKMKLDAGRGVLTLRASKIKGRQVADVRYVELIRT